MSIKKITFTVLAALCVGLSFAQGVVKPATPARLVNDFAGVIDARVARVLEDSLVAFDKATSTQIVVVTVKKLGDYTVGDYALELGREWGVGKKDKNNGIVILVKPRNEFGRGEVYISVGYGLEGVLNDAKAGKIIDRFMLPELKKGDYTAAIVNGTLAVMKTVRGEFSADDELDPVGGGVMLVAFVIFIILLAAFSKGNKKGGQDEDGSSGGSGGFFPPIIIGGFGGGGQSSGGGFGGGFGGFGGGGFGGGGAGRSF